MAVHPKEARISDAAAFASAYSVSRETLYRLTAYEGLLKQWQRAVNLVAPSTLDDIWHRHFADSAQLLSLAPPGAKAWLDIGSGAGFPGMVLAILLSGRDGTWVTLVESDQRKAAFLREVARQTGVAVDICCDRIENVATQVNLRLVDVITARALAPLPRLLALAIGAFGANTVGLFLKGRGVEMEIEEARTKWTFACELKPSLTDGEGRIAVVRNLKAKTED